MIPPGISSAIVHSTLLTIITHTSTHPGRPQPFNEFKPIEREIVPLIPQPALSQQQAEIPGNLKAMLLNVTALFSFLKKVLKVTKPLTLKKQQNERDAFTNDT